MNSVAKKSKLIVALVCPYPVRSYFGAELGFISKNSIEHPTSWVINLINQLTLREDIDLHVVTLSSHLIKDYQLKRGKVTYHFLKGSRLSLQLATFYQLDKQKIQNVLKTIHPDVVEAFGTEGPYGYAGATSGYPCVIYMQGVIKKVYEALKQKKSITNELQFAVQMIMESATIKKCNNYIVENQFSGDFVKTINPFAKLYEIPNLINPIFFEVGAIEKPTTDFLFIGSMNARKGVFNLIDAFSTIYRRYPTSTLALAGQSNNPDTCFIKNKIDQYGLSSSVSLMGKLSHKQLKTIVEKGVILVHPAIMDFSPNSVYEAMAAGIPVIASNVGGIPYMIENDKTGLLVQPGNVADLVEKMTFLLENPEKQVALGRNAKEKSCDKLDRKRIIDDTIRVYQDIV